MIKFITATIISGILFYSLGLFLPWWGSFIAGFLVGLLLQQNYLSTFLSSFLGVGLVSCIYIFLISLANDHILANRIAILILKQESPELLVIVSGLISAITAGTSAISGKSFVRLLKNNN